MSSTNTCTGFDTLDLAIVDSVYQAALVQLVVRSPALNAQELEKCQQHLLQRVLAFAKPGSADFDALYARAIASFDQTKITPLVSRSA
jgi:hypothetical protein